MTASALRGTCFGYAVEAPFPFAYLRAGSGDRLAVSIAPPDLAEREGRLVGEWRIPGDRPSHARLFADGERFRLWVDVAGWYEIDPTAPSVAVPAAEHPVRREERLFGVPTLLCFRARGDVPLHAAALEVEGGAVVLAAPRTFGKTTLAAGFVRRGYRLLSEDLTCVRLGPPAAVVPGPAVLRLRPDVAERLELPDGRRVVADDARVRIALGDDARGDCEPVPLRAVVFLRPGDGPRALERAEPAETIRDLHALSFHLQAPDDLRRSFDDAAALGATVAAWNLAYEPTLDGLDELVGWLAGRV
ncbi:MAG TPA: hypothetical protein VFA05_11830 [Gaiellaceae bacterium]|nr:hypothetical protein [Gaiellaceae bacterium]